MLTRFPYNKNEKSPHFPAQAETKNALATTSGLETRHTIYVA